jgi:hypothetical protein
MNRISSNYINVFAKLFEISGSFSHGFVSSGGRGGNALAFWQGNESQVVPSAACWELKLTSGAAHERR